jgi:hypothetical protein
VKPAVSKPAVVPPATKPIVKPAVSKPAAIPAVKPVTKPPVKAATKPIVKPVIKPVVRPAKIRPVAKPLAKPLVKPVAKPVAIKPAVISPVVKPGSKPLVIQPAEVSDRKSENQLTVSPNTSAFEASKSNENALRAQFEIVKEGVSDVVSRIIIWNRKQRNYRLAMINKNKNKNKNKKSAIDSIPSTTFHTSVSQSTPSPSIVRALTNYSPDDLKNYLSSKWKKLMLFVRTIAKRVDPQPFESLIYHAAKNNLTTFKEANRTSEDVFITNLLNK